VVTGEWDFCNSVQAGVGLGVMTSMVVGVTDESWSELRARWVQPFYRQMMGINALEAGPSVLAEIAVLVDKVDAGHVVHLLRSEWREQVIGAWLSLGHQRDESVLAAVGHALETSQGSLTAPALLTVTIALEPPAAASSIQVYYEADVANGWGSAGLALAAAACLPDSPLPGPTSADAETFRSLSVIANCLRPVTNKAGRKT
jgi:hypothetical protein